MLSEKLTEEGVLEAQIYFFEFVIRNMLIPGQVENWVAIVDVGYESLFSFVGLMKTTITFLSNTYRNRMFALYLVRCPTSVSMIWRVVRPFMEEETINKVNFFDNEKALPLFEYLDPSQLEKRHGGTRENIKDFW